MGPDGPQRCYQRASGEAVDKGAERAPGFRGRRPVGADLSSSVGAGEVVPEDVHRKFFLSARVLAGTGRPVRGDDGEASSGTGRRPLAVRDALCGVQTVRQLRGLPSREVPEEHGEGVQFRG